MTYRRGATMSKAVRDALAAAPPADSDLAVAELALTYAGLIDNAAPAARYEKALRWLCSPDRDEDEKAGDHIHVIRTALSRHSTMSDLGPKLLAALNDLMLSPRARQAATKAVTDVKPAANGLDELAAARTRKGSAGAVDATAP